MNKLTIVGLGIVLAAALGAVGYFVFAQSDATEQAAQKTEEPASPQEAPGRFGGWSLLCGKDKDGKETDRCALILRVVEKETKKQAFRFAFAYGPQGKLVLQLDTPTGVAVQRGIEFSPDTKKLYRVPYRTCIASGCQALVVVEDALRQELETSKQGAIAVYAMSGQAIRAVTAFDGLAAGMKALDQRRAPQDK